MIFCELGFGLRPMTLYSRAEAAESDDEDAETDSEADGDDDQHWGPVWEDLLPVRGGSCGYNQCIYKTETRWVRIQHLFPVGVAPVGTTRASTM